MPDLDLEELSRETARWVMLDAMRINYPVRTGLDLMTRVVTGAELGGSRKDVEKNLHFLKDLGLVELQGGNGRTTTAKLTSYGMQVAEYAKPCPAGISRPERD